MFYVFNTHEPQGYLAKFRQRWLARLVASVAGPRFDYSTVTFRDDADFGRLTF